MEENVSAPRQSMSGLEFKLHPLVLINITDHHTRTVANDGDALAVLGALLGSTSGRVVDISNSFEMRLEGGVVDDALLIKKQEQYKAVFPRLDVVGWYTTAATRPLDQLQDIHAKITGITEAAVLLVLDTSADRTRRELPVTLYETEVRMGGEGPVQAFVASPYSMAASDAERIAVDAVTRMPPSGRASGAEQLTAHLMSLHSATKMLTERIALIVKYLERVDAGELEYCHDVVRRANALVHSLPALVTPSLTASTIMEVNDTLAAVYLATITRGLSSAAELADRANMAYERPIKRRSIPMG